MADIINPILQWLNSNPEWAGLVTFLISAAESVAIIGTIIPGSITMTAIGALAGADVIPLGPTLIWAILGAVVGDSISYWLGHYFKDKLKVTWPFRNNPQILAKGETFVHHYGVMSVFIGRFVGPVRALVPLVAGMLGMKPLQFTIANVTSAIGWAPAYMLPGILLGAASLELPPDIAIHAILTLLLIVLFILLCIWLIYKSLQLISNQIEQFLNYIWEKLKHSQYFHLTTDILKHHDPQQHHGQLTLAFHFIVISLLLTCLIIYAMIIHPEHIFINQAFYHFFRGIRSPAVDSFMINLTLLGEKKIILPVLFVLFCWLIFAKRMRTALHVFALGLLAVGSVFVIKNIMQSSRPWGIFNSPESYSMPSGHATLSAAIYIVIAFILATALAPKRRWLIYVPAIALALLIGISRVYLGAHWFTDVFAGWLLSAALLILIMLSYHRVYEKPIHLRGLSIVCILTLILSYGTYYYRHSDQLALNYAQIDWPSFSIPGDSWWEKDNYIPSWNVSLFGIPSERINVQWAGDLEQIRQSLLSNGWVKPPARDWISTLHRVTGIESTAYLPMVSPEYLDKQPALILAKRAFGRKNLVVLRLWYANRRLQVNDQPLWVGTIGIVPRSYHWLFRKNIAPKLNPLDILASDTKQAPWQSKTLTLSIPTPKHQYVSQSILLIRENK